MDAGINAVDYKWSTGETTKTLSVDKQGLYSLTVSNGICNITDDIAVMFNDYPSATLDADLTICADSVVQLSVTKDNRFKYNWSTGDTTHFLAVKYSGKYDLKVSNGKCTTTDNINVEFASIADLRLSNDSIIASYPSQILLESYGTFIDTWHWIFGDGFEQVTNTPQTSYVY